MLKKFFIQLLKIVGMIFVCLALGALIVFPLWKWASSSPKSYTLCILILLIAFAVYLLIKSAKKIGIKSFTLRWSKILVIALGLCLMFKSVLIGERVLALLYISIAIALFFIIKFLEKKFFAAEK